jgi:DNA-binding CsgD family transcriptional regulator
VNSGSFAGRDDALALLSNATVALSAGVGSAVLVEGEQGIGKSELLRVGLAGVRGCRVLWGAADELDRAFPLSLMSQCLSGVGAGPLGADLQAGMAGGVFAGDPVVGAVERVLVAVDELCAVSPVILVAEDLHWADEASVLAWYRLSRAVGQLPLLLAGSLRPGTGRDDLARLSRTVARGGRVLELGPLAEPEVGVLAGHRVGGRPGPRLMNLLERAGGNPLYARELADGLVRERRVKVAAGTAELAGGPELAWVPGSLAMAIEGRLAHLAEDVVTVLRWAAVLGQEFSVADLQVVTGRQASDLADIIGSAQAAGVVADAGPRLAFRHGLIRQVLYEQMPAGLGAALHQQVAGALAVAGAAPERVAAQLLFTGAFDAGIYATPGNAGAAVPDAAGGDGLAQSRPEALQPWALDWLERVAPALTYHAPQVAVDLLQHALAQVTGDDPRGEQFEASLLAALFVLGRDSEVEQTGRRLLDKAGNPDRAAEMTWLVANSMIRAGQASQVESLLADIKSRPGISTGLVARLHALHGHVLAVLGRMDQATKEAETALASPGGDPVAPAYAHLILTSVAYMRRDSVARLAHIDQGLDALGENMQFVDLRVLMMSHRTSVLPDLDRMEEGILTGRQAVVLADRAGAHRGFWARAMLAINYCATGHWDDALTEVEPVFGEYSGYIGYYAHGVATYVAAHRHDQVAVAEHLSKVPGATEWAMRAGSQALPGALLARAVVAEQQDGAEAAIAVLAQGLEPVLAVGMPARHILMPDLTRLALAIGDTAMAGAAADAARLEAEREPLAWKVAASDHCRGLLQGDAQAVLAAADYAKAAGRPLDYGQALENAAVIAAAAGDGGQARRWFADAVRQYAQLGARWDINRAERRLSAHGIRPRHSGREAAATGWAALTPTEDRVAGLAAQGLSNPDIAAALRLSRNTVQTHISHILAKIDAHSRIDIIRQAAYRAQPAGSGTRESRLSRAA